MARVVRAFVGALSSLKLSCVLLMLLGLLTWLGTLEQVHLGLYEVQKKYFESFVLVHHAGPVPIPLPGAYLVMALLFVNLLVGGIVRLRRHNGTLGVLVVHLGIALLFVAGFVKMHHSQEGHVTLFEGQKASTFQSYHRWEIAILETLGNGDVREHLVPEERFLDARGEQRVTLSSSELPFELEISHVLTNAMPQKPRANGPMSDVAAPVVDGAFLAEQPPEKESERNIAGAHAVVVAKSGAREEALLWGAAATPHAFTVDGRTFGIELRHERYPMPFELELERFTKEDHPRIDMPKSFSSDVEVTEGGTTREMTISMNEPLRSGGLVLYQASWGPAGAAPGARLFSTFAVVRNPSDRWPLYACVVIAAGLLLHFSRKLMRVLRSEAHAA